MTVELAVMIIHGINLCILMYFIIKIFYKDKKRKAEQKHIKNVAKSRRQKRKYSSRSIQSTQLQNNQCIT